MKIIDIETVPLPDIMKTWYPEWATKKFPEMSPEEIEHQAGLYPEFGMICAIGISDPNGNPTSATAKNLDDEKEILLQLDDILAMKETLVGHNLKGFDLPFLAKRYMYHGLHVPNTLRVSNMKPWEIPHIDTMEKCDLGAECLCLCVLRVSSSASATLNLLVAAVMFGICSRKEILNKSQNMWKAMLNLQTSYIKRF